METSPPSPRKTAEQLGLSFRRKNQFTSNEEESLWRAYLSARSIELRDADVRDRIFAIHQAAVTKVARQFWWRFIPKNAIVTEDDAVGAGCLGAIKAIDSYNPSRNTTYMEWATPHIRGAIQDEVRSMQDFPRAVAGMRRRLRPSIEQYAHEIGHFPTMEEIESHFGKQFAKAVLDPLFTSSVFNQAEDAEHPNFFVSECKVEECQDARCLINELEDRVLGLFHDDRMRFVVYAYYYHKWDSGRIARNLGCSVSTVSKLHAQAKKIVETMFTSEEFREFIR